MYGIPDDLDLAAVVGQSASQLGIGQFDIQFTLGEVGFAVQSTVKLYRNDRLIGEWHEGRWPDPSFYDVMNTPVKRCQVIRDEIGSDRIEFEFDNGLVMHVEEDPDPYESMQITTAGKMWVV